MFSYLWQWWLSCTLWSPSLCLLFCTWKGRLILFLRGAEGLRAFLRREGFSFSWHFFFSFCSICSFWPPVSSCIFSILESVWFIPLLSLSNCSLLTFLAWKSHPYKYRLLPLCCYFLLREYCFGWFPLCPEWPFPPLPLPSSKSPHIASFCFLVHQASRREETFFFVHPEFNTCTPLPESVPPIFLTKHSAF